jgi:hypothetical protein
LYTAFCTNCTCFLMCHVPLLAAACASKRMPRTRSHSWTGITRWGSSLNL